MAPSRLPATRTPGRWVRSGQLLKTGLKTNCESLPRRRQNCFHFNFFLNFHFGYIQPISFPTLLLIMHCKLYFWQVTRLTCLWRSTCYKRGYQENQTPGPYYDSINRLRATNSARYILEWSGLFFANDFFHLGDTRI